MVRLVIALILAISAVKGPEECLAPSDPTGEKYNGKIGRSETGKRCQRWGEGSPLAFRRFCRKVDGKDKPGCFVKSDGQRTFQHCNIPTCPSHSENLLVLYNGNTPVMMDASGTLTTLETAFTFGKETGSYRSCSATINGKMVIFGGSLNTRYIDQISVVESCGLTRSLYTRQGNLPMDFESGACNTFTTSSGKEEALLCFGIAGRSFCHSYDGQTIATAPSSIHSHMGTSLGRLRNTPIAVGSGIYEGNKKVEALERGRWSELADFPFVNNFIDSYSMITFQDSLYLFGGNDDYKPADIAVKCTQIPTSANMWTSVGSLMKKRTGHRSVAIGGSIMHVGGAGTHHFERWTANGTEFIKEELPATLNSEGYPEGYPELFIVSSDFCL